MDVKKPLFVLVVAMLVVGSAYAAETRPRADINQQSLWQIIGVKNFTGTGVFNWSSGTIYVPQICLNGDCQTSFPSPAAGNASWNQSLASTLYAPISLVGDNSSWNETRLNSLLPGAVGQNLTLSTILANMGNWSLDKPSYVPWASVSGAVGENLTLAAINANMLNWSADKASYVPWTSVAGAVGQNLTLSLINANMGNYSASAATLLINNTDAKFKNLTVTNNTYIGPIYFSNGAKITMNSTCLIITGPSGVSNVSIC